MATERKLDIFKVLGAADSKAVEFYSSLADDERKELQPFLVARWMSGTSNASQVVLINEFLNQYVFSLTSHKQLLWQLLTICNVGKSQRYSWNKLPARRESGKSNALRAVKEFYGYSTRDAVDALDILTRSQIIQHAEDLGWQPEDITKIRRELKVSDQPDTPTKPTKQPSTANSLLEF